jgi:hypothetical protein
LDGQVIAFALDNSSSFIFGAHEWEEDKKMMAAGSSETLVFMKIQCLASKKAIIFMVFCPCVSFL